MNPLGAATVEIRPDTRKFAEAARIIAKHLTAMAGELDAARSKQ